MRRFNNREVEDIVRGAGLRVAEKWAVLNGKLHESIIKDRSSYYNLMNLVDEKIKPIRLIIRDRATTELR